jgi:hypothetical protein
MNSAPGREKTARNGVRHDAQVRPGRAVRYEFLHYIRFVPGAQAPAIESSRVGFVFGESFLRKPIACACALGKNIESSRVGFVFGESFLRKPIACACALGKNIESSRVGFVFGESFLRKPIACACALGKNARSGRTCTDRRESLHTRTL